MKINNWLGQAESLLQNYRISTARLDALVLLEHVTGIDRARLLAEPDMELSSAQYAKLEKLLKRRASHEPLAYIRGKTEFYGREFVLTPSVLEPRPESETMIDLLKAIAESKPELRIADVGTGSGALGITAALELPKSTVDLIDIDPEVLKIARMNVEKFTLNINTLLSDLLVKTKLSYDVLLCNLPYVPDGYDINAAASHEPKIAIFGGTDGLDIYRKLFKQLEQMKKQPLYILTEALPSQHTALQEIASQAAYSIVKTDDFIQVFHAH